MNEYIYTVYIIINIYVYIIVLCIIHAQQQADGLIPTSRYEVYLYHYLNHNIEYILYHIYDKIFFYSTTKTVSINLSWLWYILIYSSKVYDCLCNKLCKNNISNNEWAA